MTIDLDKLKNKFKPKTIHNVGEIGLNYFYSNGILKKQFINPKDLMKIIEKPEDISFLESHGLYYELYEFLSKNGYKFTVSNIKELFSICNYFNITGDYYIKQLGSIDTQGKYTYGLLKFLLDSPSIYAGSISWETGKRKTAHYADPLGVSLINTIDKYLEYANIVRKNPYKHGFKIPNLICSSIELSMLKSGTARILLGGGSIVIYILASELEKNTRISIQEITKKLELIQHLSPQILYSLYIFQKSKLFGKQKKAFKTVIEKLKVDKDTAITRYMLYRTVMSAFTYDEMFSFKNSGNFYKLFMSNFRSFDDKLNEDFITELSLLREINENPSYFKELIEMIPPDRIPNNYLESFRRLPKTIDEILSD